MSFSPPLNRDAWLSWMIQHDIPGFFEQPVTLASGKQSHWYVNWRHAAKDVFALEQIVALLLESIEQMGLQPDVIFGVPEGASKLAVLAQYKWAKRSSNYGPGSHILAMGRGRQKEYGAISDRAFLGAPKGRVLIIEDVTTTGQSLLDAAVQLQELEDVVLLGALSLTNRHIPGPGEPTIKEQFAAQGILFEAMVEAQDILPAAIKSYKPSTDIFTALRLECPFLPQEFPA
jgi:orotate phosphoribosyltransferase